MGVEVRHHQQPHIPSSSETSRSISHRVVETVLKAHRLHLAAKLYALRFGVLTLGGQGTIPEEEPQQCLNSSLCLPLLISNLMGLGFVSQFFPPFSPSISSIRHRVSLIIENARENTLWVCFVCDYQSFTYERVQGAVTNTLDVRTKKFMVEICLSDPGVCLQVPWSPPESWGTRDKETLEWKWKCARSWGSYFTLASSKTPVPFDSGQGFPPSLHSLPKEIHSKYIFPLESQEKVHTVVLCNFRSVT